MFCNSCGKEIADSSAFCNFCGNKIAMASESANAAGSSESNSSISEKLTSGKEAKNRKNWSGAERFYGAVLLENPSQYEALFYDAYAMAMETMSSQEVFKRKSEMNVLHTVLLDLPQYYDPDNAENLDTVTEMLDDLKNLFAVRLCLHRKRTAMEW